MKIKQDFEKLLQKDMDRRSFLKHVGIGFAAIIGITGMLKTMSNVVSPETETSGYGSRSYGGVRSDQATATTVAPKRQSKLVQG